MHDSLDIAEVLLEFEVDPALPDDKVNTYTNARDYVQLIQGDTALHIACTRNGTNVEKLLKEKAPQTIETKNKDGHTPDAMKDGKFTIRDLLLLLSFHCSTCSC